jgi:hypothetical protein
LDLAFVADVFPELPGAEVVLVQSVFPYSASVIRVVDLEGRLRYEVWHDGALGAGRWLAGPGLLVFTGVNSEHRWDERGYDTRGGRYPAVVFALRPHDGHLASGRWMVHDAKMSDDSVAWYRWLGPAEWLAPLNDVYGVLAEPGSGWDATRYVESCWSCGRGAGVPRAGFTLLLNERGDVVGRWDDDNYKASRREGATPEIGVFELLDYSDLPREQEKVR